MSVKFKRLKEVLKPKSYQDFIRFMRGQTYGIENGDEVAWDDDVLKWLKKQKPCD